MYSMLYDLFDDKENNRLKISYYYFCFVYEFPGNIH